MRGRGSAVGVVVASAVVAALIVPASPAGAAFPGVNGLIAYTSDVDGDFDI
jgi:hypothetical protein